MAPLMAAVAKSDAHSTGFFRMRSWLPYVMRSETGMVGTKSAVATNTATVTTAKNANAASSMTVLAR